MLDAIDLQEMGQKRTPRPDKPVRTLKERMRDIIETRKIRAEKNKRKRTTKSASELANLISSLE